MFYVALGALAAVGLLALLATGRVSPQNVLGLLIALSNAFGLIAGELRRSQSRSRCELWVWSLHCLKFRPLR